MPHIIIPHKMLVLGHKLSWRLTQAILDTAAELRVKLAPFMTLDMKA